MCCGDKKTTQGEQQTLGAVQSSFNVGEDTAPATRRSGRAFYQQDKERGMWLLIGAVALGILIGRGLK